MIALLFAGQLVGLTPSANGVHAIAAQASKDTSKATEAADRTRTRLLKVNVTGTFTDVRLGDVLKEFAAQVEMQTEHHLLWTYSKDFPFAGKVTFTIKDTPLDAALDQLLTKAGGTLGFVVISKSGDKYDGWVRLTTKGERGADLLPATAQEEQEAADTLTKAKGHIEGKNAAAAKVYLQLVVKKYPTAKAAAEARELLEKIGK